MRDALPAGSASVKTTERDILCTVKVIMGSDIRFIYSFFLLALLILKVQSQEDIPLCRDNEGFCIRKDKEPCHDISDFLRCEEENYVCCLDKTASDMMLISPCNCKQSETCASVDGRCDLECKPDERVDTSVPCHGKNCICCVPDFDCKESRECAEGKGRCAKRCNEREMADRDLHCEGNHCVCCVPKSHCTCSQECSVNGGRCDAYCYMNEFLNSSLTCYGDNCHCCLPRTSTTSTTSSATSSTTISTTNSISSTTKSSTTTTRGQCDLSARCYSGRGRCNEFCADHETTYNVGCGGSCKCCVVESWPKKHETRR